MSEFDEDYFERGPETGKSCYRDYRWLPELTVPMVRSIMDYCNIRAGDTVLDFGCAKGYVVRAFRTLDIDAYGVDISHYAIGHCDPSIRPFVARIDGVGDIGGDYDWLFAKDVMEHVAQSDIAPVLEHLSQICRHAFFVIPLGDGVEFTAEKNNHDVTHKTAMPIGWWAAELGHYWDEIDESYYVPGAKDRWMTSNPRAHGFFVCRSKS